MKEVIDSTAEVILQDASSSDVEYLVEHQYEGTDLIKNAIKKGIEEGRDGIEWFHLVIETEDLWTRKEYKNLLEDKLLHLVTGNAEEKEQAKQIYAKINKDKFPKRNMEIIEAKILEKKKEIIEAGISEEEKEIIEDQVEKE